MCVISTGEYSNEFTYSRNITSGCRTRRRKKTNSLNRSYFCRDEVEKKTASTKKSRKKNNHACMNEG